MQLWRQAAYAYVLTENMENDCKRIQNRSRIPSAIKGLGRALDADITKLTVFGPKLPIDQFGKIKLNAVPQKRNKAFPISVQALVEFFGEKACKEQENY